MSAQDWKETGHKFFNKGNLRNAVSAFTLALDLTTSSKTTSPDGKCSPLRNTQAIISFSAETHWYRACTYERLGEYDKAVEGLSLCLALCSSPDFASFEIQESDVRKDLLRNLSLLASTSRDTLVARRSNEEDDEDINTAKIPVFENDTTGCSSDVVSMLDLDITNNYSGEAERQRQDCAISQSSSVTSNSNQSRENISIENSGSSTSSMDGSVDDNEDISFASNEDRRDETLLIRKNINKMDRASVSSHIYAEISDEDEMDDASPLLSLSNDSDVNLPTPIRFEFDELLSPCSSSNMPRSNLIVAGPKECASNGNISMEYDELSSNSRSVSPASEDSLSSSSSQTCMSGDTIIECTAAHAVHSDILTEPITPIVVDDSAHTDCCNLVLEDLSNMVYDDRCDDGKDPSVAVSMDASTDTELEDAPIRSYSNASSIDVMLSATLPDINNDNMTAESTETVLLDDGIMARCESDELSCAMAVVTSDDSSSPALPVSLSGGAIASASSTLGIANVLSDGSQLDSEIDRTFLEVENRNSPVSFVKMAMGSKLHANDSPATNIVAAEPLVDHPECSLNLNDHDKPISIHNNGHAAATYANTISTDVSHCFHADISLTDRCEEEGSYITMMHGNGTSFGAPSDLKVGDVYSANSTGSNGVVPKKTESDAAETTEGVVGVRDDASSACSSTTIRGLSLLSTASEENEATSTSEHYSKSVADIKLPTTSRRQNADENCSLCEGSGTCFTLARNCNNIPTCLSSHCTDQSTDHAAFSPAANNESFNCHLAMANQSDNRSPSREASTLPNEICLKDNDTMGDKQFNSFDSRRVISSGSISSLSSCAANQSGDSLSCMWDFNHTIANESRGLNVISENEGSPDIAQDQGHCNDVVYPLKRSARFSVSYGSEPTIFDLLNPMNATDWAAIRIRIKNHPWEVAQKGPYPLLTMLCDVGAPSDIVQLVIEAYPDAPMIRDHTGALALHYACYNGKPENILTVLESFPEASGVCVDSGLTLPMLLYLECSSRPRVSVIEAFLNAYPEGGARNSKPLEMAFGLWNDLNGSIIGRSNVKSHFSARIPPRDACNGKATMFDVEQAWTVVMKLALHRVHCGRGNDDGIVDIPKNQHYVSGRDNALRSILKSTNNAGKANAAFKRYRYGLITTHILANIYIVKPPASTFDHEGTWSVAHIHTALDNHIRWNEGIKIIWAASPNSSDMMDPSTGLYPFMKAAVGEGADLTTIYNLAKRSSKLLSSQSFTENVRPSPPPKTYGSDW
eukprot:CAMPEP_0116014760 /NCGR_PEP_ID=MMETSP0321-20121206/6446_1 /TAXON_ID=163516 /ORGANISM="Leptocylindrus danicus var. danicus, Strain B650" /LENGTH=1263 /DNA_ID=CAMNT_0003484427 /DNA_START=23 /DNA_END=3811 /DNA_ORIENTATION=-